MQPMGFILDQKQNNLYYCKCMEVDTSIILSVYINSLQKII